MQLLEAIIEANHRAGDEGAKAVLNAAQYADALPLVALTCIDPRLNRLIPERLGVPEEQFIWLRNAGNIITGPLSSTLRSLALACAVKGGKEIALIGHTDCQVRQTTVMKLTDGFHALGIDRSKLPENLNEYFGLFASERQNVIRGTEFVRQSPLIGTKVPVHGLLMDIETGRLEWLVNGYQIQAAPAASPAERARQWVGDAVQQAAAEGLSLMAANLPEFKMGELKFPEFKIGDAPVGPVPEQPRAEAVAADRREAHAGGRELKLNLKRRFRVVGADQKVYGPIEGEKIMEWIADRRIDWQTLSQAEGQIEWKPLCMWADASGPASIPQPPPIKVAAPVPRLKRH